MSQGALFMYSRPEASIVPQDTTSGAARFLAKRGPGLHHIGYAVDDVEVEARRLSDQGLRRVDLGPKAGAAFFYPQDIHGVLTEFVPFRTPGVRVHAPGFGETDVPRP